MDIYCRYDHEPWENDCLHEEVAERQRIIREEMPPGPARERRLAAQTYQTVYEEFRAYGCGAFAAFTTGVVTFKANDRAQLERCPRADPDAGIDPAIGVIQDLLGDDADGAMSLIDDFGLI